jgi:3'-phosphoadenosine 5'-phosphosulfate sulfotransferase (PAPS reductase)/FAD synthetase
MIRREEVRHRLVLDAPLAERVLTGFVRDAVRNAGAAGVVVGLSGGVDSALAAGLAARALGPQNVHALYLPYRTSNPESAVDARASADAFGLALRTIEITPMVDAYFAIERDADDVRRGNKMARERMAILFDQAKKLSAWSSALQQDRDPARPLDGVRRQRQLAQSARRSLQAAGLAAVAAPGCRRGGRQAAVGGSLARPDRRGATWASSTRWPTKYCS